jgi:excisionase family DNA binding protein
MIEKLLLSVEEFVEIVPVKEPTVRSWITAGRLPIVRLGRLVFIKREVVDKILEEGLEAVKPN